MLFILIAIWLFIKVILHIRAKLFFQYMNMKNMLTNHPDDFGFKAESGAEAVKRILKLMDLNAEIAHIARAIFTIQLLLLQNIK